MWGRYSSTDESQFHIAGSGVIVLSERDEEEGAPKYDRHFLHIEETSMTRTRIGKDGVSSTDEKPSIFAIVREGEFDNVWVESLDNAAGLIFTPQADVHAYEMLVCATQTRDGTTMREAQRNPMPVVAVVKAPQGGSERSLETAVDPGSQFSYYVQVGRDVGAASCS